MTDPEKKQEKHSDEPTKADEQSAVATVGEEETEERSPESHSETCLSVQDHVDSTIDSIIDDASAGMLEDAVTAVAQARESLALLQQDATEEALARLKQAVETLESVIILRPVDIVRD